MSPRLFAYGSNMAEAEMAQFAPAARFLGIARLPGFGFELRRRSVRWGGGAADIVERAGAEVWGALYEVRGLERLDAKEGAGIAYRLREVKVEVDGESVAALAYEVIDKEPEPVPCTADYRKRVLAGARERDLPAPYVKRLEVALRLQSGGPVG